MIVSNIHEEENFENVSSGDSNETDFDVSGNFVTPGVPNAEEQVSSGDSNETDFDVSGNFVTPGVLNAEEQISENLLPNGHFELFDEGGNASDRVAAGDSWGSGITLKTVEDAVSGKNYLSLKADKTIYVRQPLKNWNAGKYSLSAYAKTISGKARIKAEFYDKSYKLLSSAEMEWENAREWEKKELDLIVPENTYLFSFMVRLENGGEAFFDNIIITEKEEENPGNYRNLLPNGDFELFDEGGNASDWVAAGDSWGSGITLKTVEDAVSGKNYLSLKADKTIYVRQSLKNWNAGKYSLSAYAKTISGKARIKAEFYDKSYKLLSSAEMEWENAREWEKKELDLIVPENTYLFSFMVRLENGGEVFFDNIIITEKEEEIPDNYRGLLPNGDFELFDEGGNASDWVAAGDSWGSGITLKTGEDAVSGKNYLSLKADKTIYVRQPLKNWNAGKYSLSAYAKTISGKARIKAEFYDKSYKLLSSAEMEWENAREWEKKELDLIVPENTYLFSFMVRLENGGEVFFDNIIITEKEEEIPGNYRNLLKNGGFETVDSTAAAPEWKPILGAWGEGMNIKEDNAPEGNRYVSLAGTNAMYLVQSLHDWEAGEYAFSAKMKLLSGKAAIKAEYYDASYQLLSSDQFDYTVPTDNQWIKVKGILNVPENTYLIHFMLRLTESGEVCWDDVQVLEEQDEEQLEAERLGREFREMLAEEAAVSQLTEESNLVKDPYVEKEPMTGAEDLIVNGGFENGLDNWDIFKEQFAPYSFLAEGEGRGGGNALKFTATAQQELINALRHQVVRPVSGAEYQISYWYKVTQGTSVEPVVKLEFHGEVINDILTGYSEGWPYPENHDYNRDGEWHQVVYRVRVPDYTTELHIYPRIMRNVQEDQEIYLDDISLYMTAAPTVMTLMTDDCFYYGDTESAVFSSKVDTESAVFSAKVDTGYFPEYASADVKFELYDGQQRIWQTDGVRLQEGSVSVNCSLSGLTKAKPYCVKAILYDAEGNEVAVKTTNIYKYSRPEYLTADGIFMQNGTDAFAPVLAYHVSKKDYAKVAAAGINVVQMFNGDTFSTFSTAEAALEYLDAAQEAGIMGFIPLYNGGNPAAHDSNIERTIRVLNDERVINHPALFGFGICDEPYLRKAKQSDLENSYRLIRQYDTKHPIMMVVAFAGSYAKGSNLVDILEIDPYGTAESGRACVDTQNACAASDYKKPVYTLLGTYRYESGRIPSKEEVRNNNWQALIGGAGAIGYYSIRDAEKDDSGRYTIPIWDAKDGGAMWNAITEWGIKEKSLAYDRFVFKKYSEFSQHLGEDYWYSSWETQDALYMVVLGRNQNQNIPVSIPLKNADGSRKYGAFKAEVIGGEKADTTGNGNLELTLEGIEAIFYKITALSQPQEPDQPGGGNNGDSGEGSGQINGGTGGEQTENSDQNEQTQANDRTETEETGIIRSPKTGDTQEFFLNILVLMFAAGAAAVWAFLQKKKKYH